MSKLLKLLKKINVKGAQIELNLGKVRKSGPNLLPDITAVRLRFLEHHLTI